MEWLQSQTNRLEIIQTIGRRLGNRMFNTILPARCVLCQRPDSSGYCIDCQSLLPWIDIACTRCARPLSEPGLCGDCQKKVRSQPHCARDIVVPFRYRSPVSRHIHQLKYESVLSLAPALARMLALQVMSQTAALPAVIVPVPLHPHRLRRRGYNQAALIAGDVSNLLGIPVDYGLLSRTRNTVSQTDLDETARRKNMRGAFAVRSGDGYDSIAVVDDVVTSGATMDSVCEILARNGYRSRSAWTIAKT